VERRGNKCDQENAGSRGANDSPPERQAEMHENLARKGVESEGATVVTTKDIFSPMPGSGEPYGGICGGTLSPVERRLGGNILLGVEIASRFCFVEEERHRIPRDQPSLWG
jgi:hypothetical protein